LHVVQVATQRVIKSRLSGGFSPRTNPENHHPLARTRFSSAECAGISIDLLMALLTLTAYAKTAATALPAAANDTASAAALATGLTELNPLGFPGTSTRGIGLMRNEC
jgi:hypothetical protein